VCIVKEGSCYCEVCVRSCEDTHHSIVVVVACVCIVKEAATVKIGVVC